MGVPSEVDDGVLLELGRMVTEDAHHVVAALRSYAELLDAGNESQRREAIACRYVAARLAHLTG